MDYDAIIAGASFAGLAVARNLKGKILLIDRAEIGENNTSACATYYDVIRDLNCENSLLQKIDYFHVFLPKRELRFNASKPMATFDYKAFCQLLAKNGEFDFLKANIVDYKSGTVITDQGEFKGKCIVDATGFRASLASKTKPNLINKDDLAYGLEFVGDYQSDALNFYIDRQIVPFGYAWVFPIGSKSRIGIGSAEDHRGVKERLSRFASSLNLEPKNLHGGYIPFRLREPVVDNIFMVGDSAGQVFPIVFEGIRQALFFGHYCGQVINKVITKELKIDEGLKKYQTKVNQFRRSYNFWYKLQGFLYNSPKSILGLVLKISQSGFLRTFSQGYVYRAVNLRRL